MINKSSKPYDEIVYLLQGGGALGIYQAGVCESLLQSGFSPNWVIGTSVGSIHAAIIAGNRPENRVKKLNEFWKLVTWNFPNIPMPENNGLNDGLWEWFNYWNALWTMFMGQPNFFMPKFFNPWLLAGRPDQLSFYDNSELYTTLQKVVDFDLINQKKVRLTLGCVLVRCGEDFHFDNFHQTIGPEHVAASCALPPGFPAVKIGEEYYWDGGIGSNTPFSVLLEEKDPKKLLCFIVNLFSRPNRLPSSIMDVFKFKKEFDFASRHLEILRYFCELHFLQQKINALAKDFDNEKMDSVLKKIKDMGHPTALNIVRFHYQERPTDLWSKDFNFSSQVLKEHRQAGLNDAAKALKDLSWIDFSIDDDFGAIIHDF